MIQFYKTRLIQKEQLTKDVFEFIFEILEDKEIDCKSGQFFMLQIPVEGSFPQKRAYSLASPGFMKDKFRFCIKLLENGVASNFLRKFEIGSEATFQGPFGRFVIPDDCQKNILFIATGTGIAPFYGMLEDLFSKKYPQNIELFFGLRNEEDIFYQDVLEKFAKENPNFKYHLAVSRAKEDFKGLKGRLTEHLKVSDYDKNNTEIYLCGSGAMVNEVKEKFLNEGFEKSSIHEELFYV